MTKNNTADVLKSLADETRLDLVRELVRNQCQISSVELLSSCSLALDLSQPTLSHHLSKLVKSGVIVSEKRGRAKYYQINNQLLNSVGIDASKL